MLKINIIDDPYYLTEMAAIGKYGSMEIVVWTNDKEKIPHFHIRDHHKKEDNEGCIRIDKAEYFDHSGKTMRLNASQKKDLIQFLNETDEDLGITYWKYLVNAWNRNNSDVKISNNTPMPNYTDL